MAPNPVYQKNEQWYHTLPTYKGEFGPFDSAEEAWNSIRIFLDKEIGLIHYSDWASQPEIRIACTQEYLRPWPKDLPDGIYEADSNFYTFDLDKVTCDECLLK